ncbi:hypothetical protein ACA910_014352 [Epithemia clementina (nom. ined.)]
MPSGYLKHQKGTSRKVARGGGSHRPRLPLHVGEKHSDAGRANKQPTRWTLGSEDDFFCYQSYCSEDREPYSEYDYYFDDNREKSDSTLQQDQDSFAVDTESSVKKSEAPPSSCFCPICCEDSVPLISLMNTCRKLHDPVCYGCLRRLYVVDAQQSVTNYPLCCFHPNCKTPVGHVQLTSYRLVQSPGELTRYFRFMELAKGHRGGEATATAHCPKCDHPRTFKSSGGPNRLFGCRKCHFEFVIPEHQSLVQAMEDLGTDEIGPNRGWAHCPRCKMLISKGDGCDHMTCGMCGNHFSWLEARARCGKYSDQNPN